MKQVAEEFKFLNKVFTYRFKEDLFGEVFFRKCDFCGKRAVVCFRFLDTSRLGMPYGRSHGFGFRYICGGKSDSGYVLCDRCLSVSSLVDEVKFLQERKEKLSEEIKDLRIRIMNLLEDIQDEVDERGS